MVSFSISNLSQHAFNCLKWHFLSSLTVESYKLEIGRTDSTAYVCECSAHGMLLDLILYYLIYTRIYDNRN